MALKGRVLGLALTVLFLWLAVQQVDPSKLGSELARVNYLWLVPSGLSTLVGYGLRTARWRAILSGEARAGMRTLFPILIMGFATNNLLPGRLGEFWRAYLLGRKRNVRKSAALASVVVERLFDGIVLILILSIVARVVPLPALGQQVQVLATAIFLVATLGMALILWKPVLVQVLLRMALRPAPERIRQWVESVSAAFLDGLAPLRSPSVLLVAAVFSAGVWLFEGASYYLLSRGTNLGLEAAMELPAMGLTLVMINLGIMVPAAPGYVGTQEFFGKQALGVFGVDPESALALVLVSHAVQYALVTGLGLAFFAREHLWPSSLARVTAAVAARGAPDPKPLS
ncbi:MAG: flippase-like domain-containing protein [Chloroflexi bacterium]|nr:flippase-like domain-containing protein [Chloroflexota bacterium]